MGPAESIELAERACAALAPLIAEERRERIEAVLARRYSGLTVVLEHPHDPHNGAAAMRSCEAAGLTALHVVPSADGFRFSSKVTQGCERWIEVERHASTSACAEMLRGRGFRLAAAIPGAARTMDELDPTVPLALWFGNEHEGLSQAARASADVAFTIPMVGMTRSLNLSVAIALAVFTLAGRRRAARSGAGDLDEAARAVLRARWYREDVRGADAVLRRAGIDPACT
jgi:tRNA (guanosine-2'-O-)-methyltransferase